MYLRQLLRKPIYSFSRFGSLTRRFQSSSPPPSSTSARTAARAAKILDRVPRPLRKYTDGLRTAPISHIVSFLVLHELTAVMPLVGLASWFHYTQWLPPLFSSDSSLAPGIERFGAYFHRKGWFGLSESSPVPVPASTEQEGEQAEAWNLDRPGTRIVVEVAAAYAVTKALLPLRLMLSVWATPWFARVVIGRLWGGMVGLGRGRGTVGTTASAGGVERSSVLGKEVMGKASHVVGKDIPKT